MSSLDYLNKFIVVVFELVLNLAEILFRWHSIDLFDATFRHCLEIHLNIVVD